ncbi:helix-turn-helix domain-containing protein [Clostridium sp. C2-6-12]|uniref:GH39 family glycosyl hydrolase n=1 Tax=Clostridium sp. C2-6-12 TaxID=2698832 RepID=UPI00136D7A17|nr:helix-turn-helix domain-containing protein [Clostridium sp. C2-6-12]
MFKDEIIKNKYIERIDKIKEYINSNYKKSITLNDFAEKELLSIPYLSKFIKKNLGMTFTEYLNSVRLNYALEELINTDKPITRIALENGFSTTFLFNKCFKEAYKSTPNEYRKKFKRDSKIEDKISNELEIYLNRNHIHESEIESTKKETKIIIDISKEKKIKKHYNKFLNVGYANDILQTILQEHILMLRYELKFEYARFWGIFNEDMNIGSEEQKYNFYKIDRVLDFFINNKIKPFIDLSPKAKSISKNVLEVISFEIEAVKYRSIEQWKALLNNFIIHCINRYGREEVEKWYFEVSTYKILEPKIQGENYNLKYYEIFDAAYRCIKKIIPNAKVGGPGDHFGESDPAEFFKEWMNFKSKPDFISIYIYPYSTVTKNGKETIYHSNDKDFLVNKLHNVKEIINSLGYSGEEIIISEWSLTISSRNYINDSCFKAAYLVKNIIDSVDKVDSLCYWTASDISEEYLDINLLLQGGTGLLSKNGMKKPSFYALSFLERLSEIMVQKGKNYIMTKKSDSIFTIICHNYKHFNDLYFQNYQENRGFKSLMDIYENQKELNISFLIQHVPNGKYRLKSYILNESYGSVLNKWIKLNADSRLRSDEISYLKDTSIPELDIEYIDVFESKLSYSLELQPHEVRLLTFEIDYN